MARHLLIYQTQLGNWHWRKLPIYSKGKTPSNISQNKGIDTEESYSYKAKVRHLPIYHTQ